MTNQSDERTREYEVAIRNCKTEGKSLRETIRALGEEGMPDKSLISTIYREIGVFI